LIVESSLISAIEFVDKNGKIKLPEDFREEINLKKHVILRLNKKRGIIEIIPIKN